jgi:ubiquinone/menaquinone biosynthesis C-methylase UbiE
VALGLGILLRTIQTLRALEVVEAERDRWQRASDVLAALEVGPGGSVADVGSGAGDFAMKLAGVVGQGGRVYAIDIRSLPLRFLRLRALLGGRANISIVEGDVDDPHLPAEAVDGALVANTYHELARPGRWWLVVARRPPSHR